MKIPAKRPIFIRPFDLKPIGPKAQSLLFKYAYTLGCWNLAAQENVMLGVLRLTAILILAAQAAFGIGPRIIQLNKLPPAVRVIAAGAPLPTDLSSALNNPGPAIANILKQGPLAILPAGPNEVLLVPQNLTKDSQVIAIPINSAGGKTEPFLIPIKTHKIAADLQASLAANNIASAYSALGRTFDASALSAGGDQPVAVTVAAAPTTRRSALKPATARASGPRRAPPAADGATKETTPRKAGAQPLPDPNIITSDLPSLDEAVEMDISHSYPGKPGVNPAQKAAQMIDEYIAFKGIPNSKKHIVIKYFEIGDPETGHAILVQAIKRLIDAGIRTTVITDFNQSLIGKFPQDELRNTDFENATYKDNQPGRALKYLRESLGFKLNYDDGPFSVLSGVPLFNPRDKEEKPLMHDKGIVAMGANGGAYEFAVNGTANMNNTEEVSLNPSPAHGGRYNRVLLSKDPKANQVDLDQAMGEIKAYSKRQGSKGISTDLDVPQRITYTKTEEFREIAFTNGRQNTNDRSVAMLIRATKALENAKTSGAQQADFEISELILNEFVLTNTSFVNALRGYLKALLDFYPKDYAKHFKVYGAFDQQFISPDGFGEVSALAGVLVQRPIGKGIFPFRNEFSAMMELFAYVRLLDNAATYDPDSAPIHVHLLHDKTHLMKTTELDPASGQRRSWTYAFTRSFNLSNHYQSMESQDMYRMLPDSRLAKEFEDSIKEVVKAEPQYYIPLDLAIAMSWLAHFTHHTIYDTGLMDLAQKVADSLSHQNYQEVGSLIAQIAGLPTKHIKGLVDSSAVTTRSEQFISFLNWYAKEVQADRSLNKMTVRKAVNIGVALATQNAWNMRTALDIVYWVANRDEELTLKLMRRAWAEGLKMDIPFPESKKEREAAPAAK